MRYFLFLFSIVVGVGLGLFYGRVVSPVELVDTAPNTLRMDYQADYVLMVAEAYQVEEDLSLAVRRLALLGRDDYVQLISDAGLFAAELGYTYDDLQLMRDLSEALRSYDPAQQVTAPMPSATPTPLATETP